MSGIPTIPSHGRFTALGFPHESIVFGRVYSSYVCINFYGKTHRFKLGFFLTNHPPYDGKPAHRQVHVFLEHGGILAYLRWFEAEARLCGKPAGHREVAPREFDVSCTLAGSRREEQKRRRRRRRRRRRKRRRETEAEP